MGICKVEWCDENVKGLGYCGRHYQQYKKWGIVKRCRADKNEIIKSNEYAEIILYDINYDEKARAIIDLDDVEKCKPYKWVIRTDGYVSTKMDGKGIKLHRFIANTSKGMHTDHVNRNKLDNRKSNLRICTQSENNKNKNTYKNNLTGRRGVELRWNKFLVYLTYNGVKNYIGMFENFNDAVLARENAEIKYYGHVLEDI